MFRTCAVVLTALLLLLCCGGNGGEEGGGGTNGGTDVDSGPAPGTKRFTTPMKFTIDLPDGWEPSPHELGGFHYVSPKEGDETPDFQENIGFKRADAPDDADAEWVMNQALAPLPADGLGVVEGDEKTLTADGHKVLRRKIHRDSMARSYYQYYVVPRPGFAIRITATIPDVTLDKYGPIFDTIVSSMRFRK